MTTAWLDGFTRDDNVRGAGGGSFLPAAPCGVIHTTEGSNIEAARSVYRNKMVAPHCTVDPARRIRLQHLPLDRSAYALVNDNGGVETNRHGARQVEVVGFAAQTDEWPDEWIEWLATEVVRPISAAAGITGPGLTCYGEDAGWILATPNARQRMSFDAWNRFDGWCGHQHVPENSHWDPGALDLPRIVQLANNTGAFGTMDDQQITKLFEDVAAQANARTQAITSKIEASERRTRRLLKAVARRTGMTDDEIMAVLNNEHP